MCVSVCVCVCVRERETKRERNVGNKCPFVHLYHVVFSLLGCDFFIYRVKLVACNFMPRSVFPYGQARLYQSVYLMCLQSRVWNGMTTDSAVVSGTED